MIVLNGPATIHQDGFTGDKGCGGWAVTRLRNGKDLKLRKSQNNPVHTPSLLHLPNSLLGRFVEQPA